MQRQKQQAISPDVQAVAKALRKKEGGADEALRLVEHLPDKEALELLLEGASTSRKRLDTPIIFLCGLSFVLILSTISERFIFWELSSKAEEIFAILAFLILFLASCIRFNFFRFREEIELELAVIKWMNQIKQTDALDTLLCFLTHSSTRIQTHVTCWPIIRQLLGRLSDDDARALSPKARDYLISRVQGDRFNLPRLSDTDKIATLLVLSVVRNAETKALLQNQLSHPNLREAVQSMLEDW